MHQHPLPSTCPLDLYFEGDDDRDILTVDWRRVRLWRAASGLVAMAVALLGAELVGATVLSGALAALFVVAFARNGSLDRRLPGMVRFTAYGAVLGGLIVALQPSVRRSTEVAV